MLINKFSLRPDKDNIFRSISLSESSPAYAAAIKAFGECNARFNQIAEPNAVYEYDEMPIGEYPSRVWVLVTLGDKVNTVNEEYFSSGEYLKALIFNAMCDNYLMQADNIVRQNIANALSYKNMCIKEGFYPHENISAEQMLCITERLDGKSLGISVNSAYILSPLKSMGYILGVSNGNSAHTENRCAVCSNIDCQYRKL